jgi:hypothetical protein
MVCDSANKSISLYMWHVCGQAIEYVKDNALIGNTE